LAAMESIKQYSNMLLSSGTAFDVTRSANSLHSRAEELMMFDVISHVDSSLPSLSVNFTPSIPSCVENLNVNMMVVETLHQDHVQTSDAPIIGR